MRYSAAVLLGMLALAGCEQPPEKRPSASVAANVGASPLTPATRERSLALKQLGAYWLTQLTDCTAQLDADTRQFLGASHQAALDNVKQMLHTCHTLYQATELLLGVSPQQQAAMDKVRRNLNSPLALPGYVDSIEGYPGSGIVHDTSLTMTEATLRQQHGLTSEEDVSVGFDVIAFLVYGEHHFNPQVKERTLKELTYKVAWDNGRTDLPVSEHPQNRRRLYLQLATGMLRLDSMRLLDVWNKGPLPFTEKGALEWQAQVLKNGLALLERYPGNSDVHMALNQWLSKVTASAAHQPADGAITVATDPAQLRDDVQQAIAALLTGQG